MSTVSTPLTTWQWPADLLAFAARHQVQACLDPLLQATRQLFLTARSLQVYLQADPEIRDQSYIVFEVLVPQTDIPDYRAAQHRWGDEVDRRCPGPGYLYHRPYPARFMNPRDFLEVADEWAGGTREAEWRSAVSRAYYAVHHVARRMLEEWGFAVPTADQAHAFVWLRLALAQEFRHWWQEDPPRVESPKDEPAHGARLTRRPATGVSWLGRCLWK
jgi:hypothetical protein